jgi:hypothetical protein
MLTLFMLAGCFDSAETTVAVNVATGETHVLERMHNAWPATVGCGDKDGVLPSTEECAKAIGDYLAEEVSHIKESGGTVAKAGFVLVDGKLDVVYDYTAPLGGKSLADQGLNFYWAFTRSPADVKASRPGKKSLALLLTPQDRGACTVTVDGKYTLIEGKIADAPVSLYTLSGKSATVHALWTNAGDPGQPSPGAWLRDRPGLEAALGASGLIVAP